MDVTLQNFESEVITASMQVPVLVDFWADWCGPCKQLGPILDKLEQEYAGRFKLVKINADEQQQLVSAFGVRSLPTCILLMGGKPVDGFMGLQPEGKIKSLLDKHIPSEDALQAQAEAQEAQAFLESGDTQAALDKLAQALEADPANDEARFDYVRLLLQTGFWEDAQAQLQEPLSRIPRPLRFEALECWRQALLFAHEDPLGQLEMHEYEARIAQNKRDFETRYAKSRVLMAAGEWEAAMQELLEIIMRDKTWNDQAARKTFVAILELLTPAKPKANATLTNKTAGGIELAGKAVAQQDPQQELVSRYRRQLSMALN